MEDDSPLLTPEEPRRAEPDASRAKQNRRDDSPLLTPEEPRQEADASRVKHAKRPRPAAEAAAPEEPEVAFCRSDSSTLGAFGKTSSAEKYRKIEKVGVGAYGNVFKAENCETKEIVAIKVTFRQEDPLVGGFPVSLLREIGILKRVRHENIVQIHEVAHTPQGDPLVVMEFCQASLLELIHSQKHDLSFSEIKYIIRQVLDATNHLHERGILHRDLATKNVLFNLSGEIKVCDFGISRMAFAQDNEFGFISSESLENPNQIVSLPYRAIELLLGDPNYGPALDVWAVGCILVEILMCRSGRPRTFFGGDPDNPNKNPGMMVEEIFQIMGRPTEESWPGITRLPFFKTYNSTSTRVTSARSHSGRGEERNYLRMFFVSGEGKCAHQKYCLTETCFDLLAGLFTLCPAHRTSTGEALKHNFFIKEKPVPEWHAWHWALASSEIPRGNKMRRGATEDGSARKLLKQLSQDEVKVTEDGSIKATAAKDKSKEVLEKWRFEVEKKEQAERRKEELKKAAERKAAERKGVAGVSQAGGGDDKLPAGWTKHWSSSKQRYYYHDGRSGKNLWHVPGR